MKPSVLKPRRAGRPIATKNATPGTGKTSGASPLQRARSGRGLVPVVFLVVLVLVVLPVLAGCAHGRGRTLRPDGHGGSAAAEAVEQKIPDDLAVSRSVGMAPGAKAQGETAFLTVSDATGLSGHVQERVKRHLVALGFVLTDQPSRADRIVTLKILHRGPADPAALDRAVKAGYDAPLDGLARGGAAEAGADRGKTSALVADVLLVRRRVPTRGGMHNVASRNTMSGTKLRLGLASSEKDALAGFGLEEALGRELAGLAASNEDVNTYRPSSVTPVKQSVSKSKKYKKSRKSAKSRSSKKSSKKKSKK